MIGPDRTGTGDKDGFMGEVREGLGEMASPADLGEEMANWLLGAASMQVLMATGAADDAGTDPVAINRAAARMLSGADCEHDDELKTAFARLLARQLESLLMVPTAEQLASKVDPADLRLVVLDRAARPGVPGIQGRVDLACQNPEASSAATSLKTTILSLGRLSGWSCWLRRRCHSSVGLRGRVPLRESRGRAQPEHAAPAGRLTPGRGVGECRREPGDVGFRPREREVRRVDEPRNLVSGRLVCSPEALEVRDVVRHENPALGQGRLEDLQVRQSAQDRIRNDRAAVDAVGSEIGGDRRREHLIEEQRVGHVAGYPAHSPSSSCCRSHASCACSASVCALCRKSSTSSG